LFSLDVKEQSRTRSTQTIVSMQASNQIKESVFVCQEPFYEGFNVCSVLGECHAFLQINNQCVSSHLENAALYGQKQN